MFIKKEEAENTFNDEEEEIEESSTSPVENEEVEDEIEKSISKKDRTKEYSERLKQDRARIEKEVQENLVKQLGFDSFDDFINSSTDKELLDKGYDPKEVRPLIDNLVVKHPKYKELENYKKEQEAKEAEAWSNKELQELNTKFETSYNSIDDLDEDTIEMFNKGISLQKAYVANNYERIQNNRKKKSSTKGHLTEPGTGGGTSRTENVKETNERVNRIKAMNPDATEEQIKAFIDRMNK